MDKRFSIKEISTLTGLSPSNIRYYESEGLIQDIDRDDNGIRRFKQQQIEWIQFLGRMKDMEMPIVQMKEYADLRLQGDSTIRARMAILERHKEYLLHKIDNLYGNIGLLDHKLEVYQQAQKKIDDKQSP